MDTKKKSQNAHSNKGVKQDEVICLCNCVPRKTIEEAIRQGADTLNKIFDATTAGVGPCGGSCRRRLQPLLEGYLKTGEFPQHLKKIKKNRR